MFQDKLEYQRVKKQLAGRLVPYVSKQQLFLSKADDELLHGQFHLVFPLIELLLEALPKKGKTAKGVTPKENSCLSFLSALLTEIRYKVDLQESFAIECSEQCQRILAENAPLFSSPLIEALKCCFAGAQLPLIEELKSAFFQQQMEDLDATATSAKKGGKNPPSLQDLDSQMEAFIKLLGKESPFDGCAILLQEVSVAPRDIQLSLFAALHQSREEKIRELVPLLILNIDREIRIGVAQILLESPKEITPLSLRRLIMMRNWLPADEQEGVDAIVEAVRLEGVACAPLAPAKVINLSTGAFDGSGVQMLLALVKGGNKDTIAGFLCKEATGIRDPWFVFKAKSSDFKRILRELSQDTSTKASPTKTSYLEKMVPHYLAIGKQFGKIPELDVLQLVEVLGNYWVPKAMNLEKELAELRASLPQESWTAEKREEYLGKINELHHSDPVLDTWFECGDHPNRVFDKLKIFDIHPTEMTDKEFSRISEEILEPIRDRWLNKIFCMAMRDFTLERQNQRWVYFVALAEEMMKGGKLIAIEFFKSVIMKSIIVSLQNSFLGFR